MTKKLQQHLCILLTSLFGVLLIGALIFYNWGNYRNQISGLCREVRLAISDVSFEDFVSTQGEILDLGEIEYCIFQIQKDAESKLPRVEIFSNRMMSIPEEKLQAYANEIVRNWKKSLRFSEVTYITKQSHRYGKYLVLIHTRHAWAACMPMMMFSAVLACVGIGLLALLMRLIALRMVRPVEQMLEAEKKFVSNAGHELKTPLTVISANLQLLESEIGENRHLTYISQETERMIQMVSKLLTLMRLDAPGADDQMKNFYADEALLDIIYPMESVAYEKNLQMEYKIDKGMQMIGEEESFKTLISILLDNAISYTTMGGKISIYAEIRVKKLCLRVSNTGEAIPKEQREKLFERFYRRDEARENEANHFGLGLSIAAGIVEKHHGKIQVKSEGGENTFFVQLPIGKILP